MDNEKIIMAGVIGGFVAAILNSIPFLNVINCFCCMGIMLGGATALVFYDRSFENPEYINSAIALTLGIASGIFGAFFSMGIEWIVYFNFGNWELELLQQLVENMDEIPPFMEEIIQTIEEEKLKGFTAGIVLLRNLIIMPVFCLIGSFFTRLYLNRKRS